MELAFWVLPLWVKMSESKGEHPPQCSAGMSLWCGA